MDVPYVWVFISNIRCIRQAVTTVGDVLLSVPLDYVRLVLRTSFKSQVSQGRGLLEPVLQSKTVF